MKIGCGFEELILRNEKAGSPKEPVTPFPSEISVPRVGLAIKRLRTRQGMSLQDLSRLSGVSVGMLSQVERDLANPSLKVLTKIQAALGAKAGELFNETWTSLRDPGF